MPSASLSTAKDVYAALRHLLAPEVILPVNSQRQTEPTLRLRETDPGSKLKFIELSGFETHVLAFKMDSAQGRVSALLNAQCKDIHKGCDALIFARIQQQDYIFICEMKSDKPKGFVPQFKSSEAFLDYLDALLKAFSGFSIEGFQRTRLVFSTGKRLVDSENCKPRLKEKDGIYFWLDSMCSKENYRHIKKDILNYHLTS